MIDSTEIRVTYELSNLIPSSTSVGQYWSHFCLPFSLVAVSITMRFTLSFSTSRQKFSVVEFRGPYAAINNWSSLATEVLM